MASKRLAQVDAHYCVACGCCEKVCPLGVIHVWRGVYAQVERERCVGCGACVKECPAGTISLVQREDAV